jgi:regulatory protein
VGGVAAVQPRPGKRALSDELRRKGVDAEVVREAVDEVDPPTRRSPPAGSCARSCRRSAGRRATATRRLVGMLARKGYSAGLAFAVVKDELGAAASGDDEADDS